MKKLKKAWNTPKLTTYGSLEKITGSDIRKDPAGSDTITIGQSTIATDGTGCFCC